MSNYITGKSITELLNNTLMSSYITGKNISLYLKYSD